MEKSPLTYEWITITTKNGVTYERRQRKKIKNNYNSENDSDPRADDLDTRTREWDFSPGAAGLKDKLAYAVKYEGHYYDSTSGNLIPVPARYRDVIESRSHSKSNARTFAKWYYSAETDEERKKKDDLINTIKRKNEIRAEELERHKRFSDKVSKNVETLQRHIAGYLDTVKQERSTISGLLWAIQATRRLIHPDIDPTVVITYQGKNQEKPLSEVQERLEAAAKTKKPYENTGISKL